MINHYAFEKLLWSYLGLLLKYRLVLSNLSAHNNNNKKKGVYYIFLLSQ